jgi:hypothetical protein
LASSLGWRPERARGQLRCVGRCARGGVGLCGFEGAGKRSWSRNKSRVSCQCYDSGTADQRRAPLRQGATHETCRGIVMRISGDVVAIRGMERRGHVRLRCGVRQRRARVCARRGGRRVQRRTCRQERDRRGQQCRGNRVRMHCRVERLPCSSSYMHGSMLCLTNARHLRQQHRVNREKILDREWSVVKPLRR